VQTTVAITWVRDTRIARSGSRNDIPILGGAGYPHLIDTTALPRASHSRQRSRGSISSLRGACRSGAAIAGTGPLPCCRFVLCAIECRRLALCQSGSPSCASRPIVSFSIAAAAVLLRSQERSKAGFGPVCPAPNPRACDVAEREADQNREQRVFVDLPRNRSGRATTRIDGVLRHSACLRPSFAVLPRPHRPALSLPVRLPLR
jgi:hypothetical protein